MEGPSSTTEEPKVSFCVKFDSRARGVGAEDRRLERLPRRFLKKHSTLGSVFCREPRGMSSPAATSHLLLLLLGRVAGGSHRAICPLSKVSLEYGQNFWTGLPAPAPLAASAVNCSWYQSSSCCSAEDTARISQQEPEIRLLQSSRGCRDVLHMLMCSSCSPRQEELFVPEQINEFTVPVLRVCESTCDRLYQKCASANYEGRGRVDLTFSSGHQLCTAAGVRVVREEDHAVCFSAAAPRRPLAPWCAFAAGLAALIVLTLERGRAGVLPS